MTDETRKRIKQDRGDLSLSQRELWLWYGCLAGLVLLTCLTGINTAFANLVTGVCALGIAFSLGALFVMPKQFRKHLFAAWLIFALMGATSNYNAGDRGNSVANKESPAQNNEAQSEANPGLGVSPAPKSDSVSNDPAETKKTIDLDEVKSQRIFDKQNDERALKLVKKFEGFRSVERAGNSLLKLTSRETLLAKRFGKFYSDYKPFQVYGVTAASSSEARFEVNGTVFNTSNRLFPYVEVEVEFLDQYGKSCGRSMTNTTDLGAKQAWTFHAVKYSEDARRYVIRSVRGKER